MQLRYMAERWLEDGGSIPKAFEADSQHAALEHQDATRGGVGGKGDLSPRWVGGQGPLPHPLEA